MKTTIPTMEWPYITVVVFLALITILLIYHIRKISKMDENRKWNDKEITEAVKYGISIKSNELINKE